ncbi:MAG TPA: AMP-binding protein [Dehalococcoidia bacterium]|nr:AMP-binding protein [Dehalococcoidia bacterium]
MVLGRIRIAGTDDEPRSAFTEDDPLTFQELLELQRRRHGQKTLFQVKTRREWRRYSHAETFAQAHTVAAALNDLGLRRGDRAALILENSPEWAFAYYGIVLNGGIAVPIYYDLKPVEIEAMARHAAPSIAIVSAKALPKVRDLLSGVHTIVVVPDPAKPAQALAETYGQQRVLSFDDLPSHASGEARARVAATEISPEDVASIVFTSGTSGGAKGVMLTHRNFMANLQQVRRSIPFNERDRLVMVLPLHHAFPFTVTVVVAPYVGGEVTFENDLRRIRDRMAEVKPTLFLGVPALFEVMYRNIIHGIETQGRLEQFQRGLRIVEATKQRTGINIGRIVFRELHKRLGGSLRFMVSGGAALNPQVTHDFAMLGVAILQGWGLSEGSPVLSVQRWHPRKFYLSNHYEEHAGSIGQPLDGLEIALIDVPEKELYVRLHGEGELIARGENVTPGYWDAEEESRAIKVGEWLRTGDVGRIDADGTIWITGRSKFVIVLDSGEKVHPDEVEEKLELHPVIQDIVVLGRKARGKTQIVAVVYPNRDEVLDRRGRGPIDGDDVRAAVQDAIREQEADIAQYKRISEFMLTDQPLPRTPIRKVMRGHIADSYSFDVERWAESWREFLEAAATPEPDAEIEEEAVLTA